MADQQRVICARSIERRRFQWPWTTPTPSFKVTPFFDAKYLINGTTYRHSFNEILIATYTRPTQQCHFEWPWVILSDLAKYSMTQSVARSLCDNWASCYHRVAQGLYFADQLSYLGSKGSLLTMALDETEVSKHDENRRFLTNKSLYLVNDGR